MALDPLTALSVAGTVVQFVDFGSKLVSRSQELYRSSNGNLSVNEELSLITTALLKLITKLRRPMASEELNSSDGDDYQSLITLCDSCAQLAEELLTRLQGLKIAGKLKMWRSIQQAIKSCWAEKDVDSLFKRLAVFRQSIETHILVGLRDKFDVQAVRASDRFASLNSKIQHIITALLDTRTAFTSDLEEQTIAVTRILDRIEVVIIDQHDKTRAMIIDAVQRAADTSSGYTGSEVRKLMTDVENEEDRLIAAVGDGILKSLHFPMILERQQAIPEAHEATFDWIFQHATTKTLNTGFVDWLRNGGGIYWINGKAGSGKSTLMRYLYDNPRTLEHLNNWSNPMPLCIAAFFFWNSGTPQQRSQSGLLRSLLHEVLRKRRDLIPIVFPRLWAKRYTDLIDSSMDFEREAWSLSKLKQAFKLLVRQDVANVKICLFIDGLDEYDGDHDEIAQLFEAITTSPYVKVCLSSRPLVLFEDVFGLLPGLRLQDLTIGDVRHYVTDTLGNHRQFQRLALQDPRRTSALIEDIVMKAEGVFLWVKLVVKSLLAGLSNRDNITDLQQRLKLLPSDLEALYTHMLSCIDPFYAKKASEIFQIERSAREYLKNHGPVSEDPEPLTLAGLWFAYDEECQASLHTNMEPLGKTLLQKRCKAMENRLKGQCAGLLETQPSSTDLLPMRKIQYLHRTVREYLERKVVWDALVDRTAGTKFNPNISMLRSCVLQLKSTPKGQITRSFWRIVLAALIHAHLASDDMDHSHILLIDGIHQTVLTHLSNSSSVQTEIWEYDDWTSDLQRQIQRSFMHVAVQYGLHQYLKEKLDQGFLDFERAGGKPLLHYAVDPRPIAYRYPLSAKIVTLLLEHTRITADPNECFMEESAWHRALIYAFEQSYQNFNEPRQGMILDQIEILTVMLIYGADPKALCKTRVGLLPASDIVDAILRRWNLPQATELSNFLKTRIAEVEDFTLQRRRKFWFCAWSCFAT